jgi:hypothetical protein
MMYVDNKEFLAHLTDYRQKLLGFKQSQNDTPAPYQKEPRISDDIGRILIKIATNIAKRPNFNGYPFKEDMIGDGILNALIAVKTFDPEKSKNPFGYFSTVIFYCFIRKIVKEKEELSGKQSIMFDVSTFDDSNGEFSINKDDMYLWYNSEY